MNLLELGVGAGLQAGEEAPSQEPAAPVPVGNGAPDGAANAALAAGDPEAEGEDLESAAAAELQEGGFGR